MKRWRPEFTVKYLAEGGVIPLGYGVAWRDHERHSYVCLPIGINVIGSMVRRIYHWILFYGFRRTSVVECISRWSHMMQRLCPRCRGADAEWLSHEMVRCVTCGDECHHTHWKTPEEHDKRSELVARIRANVNAGRDPLTGIE